MHSKRSNLLNFRVFFFWGGGEVLVARRFWGHPRVVEILPMKSLGFPLPKTNMKNRCKICQLSTCMHFLLNHGGLEPMSC